MGKPELASVRYCRVLNLTMRNDFLIFWGDIPLHSPYIGLVYGRYLHFRILKWQFFRSYQLGLIQIAPCIERREFQQNGAWIEPGRTMNHSGSTGFIQLVTCIA